MAAILVDSGAIAQVEYFKKKQEFDVLFRDGTFASYKGVPEKIYLEFLKAPSKGKYFNYNIRDIYKVSQEGKRMCTASTAKRRRRQAANNYRHLSKQRRPHYNKVDATKSARREQQKVENQRRMAQKKH